jgi:hypothetical protein
MFARNASATKASTVREASAECFIGIGAFDLLNEIPIKWFGNV